MKISELLAFVDAIKPNAFPASAKVAWLNEVEGMVWTDVMLLAPMEFKPYAYDDASGEGDAELLVAPPHNKLYNVYICAMIDFANGEYDKYQNSITLFNSHFGEFMRWYAMHYRPADGDFSYMGIYISAYGIAVKHGYTGTEADWLASLQGQPGERGEPFTYEDFTEEQLAALMGPPGLTVTKAVINAEGHLIITLSNDTTLDAGYARGERGLQGEKGEPFTYDDFTDDQLAALTGPQGEQGLPGEKGETGERGPQGETGATGATGPQGPQGIQGVAGATGPQGPQGEKGETGERGPQGATGATGERGPQGATGATGEQGPAGKDGKDGKNFTILGYYPSLAALRAAVPDPEIGDAYGVGSAEPYNVYVLDGVTLDWLDNGSLSGVAGADGKDGVTFTPSVSSAGVISWTNDGGRANPPSVNIKGPAGADGNDGEDGVGIQSVQQTTTSSEDGGTNVITVTLTNGAKATFSVKNGNRGSAGADGYTPQKDVDYFDGEDGRGIKTVARTSGTGAAGTTDTYTITYTDNTTSKFTVYNGKNGNNGADGVGVVNAYVNDDGILCIELDDGNEIQAGYVVGADGYTPQKGVDYFDGKDGQPGADGYTPVKGTDYWTEADKAEMVSDVLASLPTWNGGSY